MDQYIDKFDKSTWNEASDLSCSHMKRLAIQELRENNYYTNKILCHPAWNRFHEFSDRDLELNIHKGLWVDKKSCMYKKPLFKDGDWENKFAVYNPFTETTGCDIKIRFDENTKSKMSDNKPCYPTDILANNGNNKQLTTDFNQEYYQSFEKLKEKSDNIVDRYNNHNPVVGDEFTRPATLHRNLPQPITDPNYEPYYNYIPTPIRNPKGSSDCSTLYNYDRYNDNKNNKKIFLEHCSNP